METGDRQDIEIRYLLERNHMKTALILMMALCSLSLAADANSTGKPISVLLEEAQYQEETVGDVNAAIVIYEKIMSDEAARRPQAAKAMYRYGMCVLKKGDKDKASAIFKQVVEKYSDQKIFVLKAQKELEKLGVETSENPTGPPAILETVPKAFATDVDASVSEMRVRFNQEMMDKSWSWTGGGETFPQSAGDIHYDETKKTCVRPVKLEAGKVYWVGVNSPSHKNFKNPQGLPAPWYIILFATKGADGKPTPLPADLLSKARAINQNSKNAAGASVAVAGSSKADKLAAENCVVDGWKLWQERKLGEAEAKFKQAVEADPQNDGAYQGLGWAQLNQGKKLNAQDSFEKCVAINPQNSAALNGLGWLAEGQGDKDKAVEWWEKAAAVQPGATASLSGLAQVAMEKGEYDKAAKYYEQILKYEPDSAEARAGLEKAKGGQK